MNAPLATFEELKMLHRIRDIDLLPIEPGFMHGFAQESPGRTDKGEPFAVFFIAGLLADHRNFCVLRSCAEDNVGGMLIRVTSAAGRCGGLQLLSIARGGNPRCRRKFWQFSHPELPPAGYPRTISAVGEASSKSPSSDIPVGICRWTKSPWLSNGTSNGGEMTFTFEYNAGIR